jgi:hypothetical protein
MVAVKRLPMRDQFRRLLRQTDGEAERWASIGSQPQVKGDPDTQSLKHKQR